MAADLNLAGILSELAEGDIEFLVIGGVAVGFHGYVRATKDIDIVPAPDHDNLAKLARALERLDARVEGAEEIHQDDLPDPLDPDALALRGNWVLDTRLGQLDIMQWFGDEALWEKLAPGAVEEDIGDLQVKFAGFDDLVDLKETAGRPEDTVDLKRLNELRGDL